MVQPEDVDVEFVAEECERNSLHNSKALISSLPHEVVTNIFKIGRDSLPHTWDHIPFEILVSHVTRHWREVALATTTLWAIIYRHEWQYNLEPIMVYLQRSRQTPMELVVKIGTDDVAWGSGDEEYDYISPFCDLIEPHFPRCHRLVIKSQNSREDSKMLQWLSPRSSPNIQSLNLYLTHTPFRRQLRILNGVYSKV